MQNSERFAFHPEFILSQLRSDNSYARALAYLVCRALLAQLSGERRNDIAYDVLTATGLTSLEVMGDLVCEDGQLQEVKDTIC